MAHGFLSYKDDIGQSWFEKKLEEELDKQTKNLKGFIRDKFTDLLFNLRTKSPRSPKPYSMSKEDSVPLAKAFEGSSVKGALSPGSDGVNPSSVHSGPIATQVKSNSKPLNPEALARDAIVDLTPGGDGTFFAKHAEYSAPPEGGGSGTGTGEIIRVLEEQTEVISSLVQATDDQTDNQSRIAQSQKLQADKLARKSKIAAETAGFSKDDFSNNVAFEALGAGGRNLLSGRGVGGGLMGGGLGMMGMGLGGKVAARKLLTNSIMRRGAGRAMRRTGIALGSQFSRGLGKKLGKKLASKGIGKIAGGALGKSLGKKVPLLGLGLGALFAAQRAMSGDWTGAGLELASGTASMFPGIGTGASVGIDAALMARDIGRMDTGGSLSGFPGNSILSVNGNPLTSFNEAGANTESIKIEKDGPDSGLKIGEGILEAQRRNKTQFGKVQAEGFKEYYDKQGGWTRMSEFNTNVFNGFGKTLKDILGAFTFPGGYKPFQFTSNDDGNGNGNGSENITQYGKKKDGFWSKRHSGEQMQVNADGVFQSKIGGVVTKIGEHDDLGKYVDIVNSEKGVTERIADISEVMPGIEVGASIGPGDPVAKGNNAGIVHYEIRNGGNENPEKYKAKFGHGGTKDPSEFLEGITNVENTSSTVLNNLSEETSGKANSGTTIINNVVNEQSNASNNQGTDVALGSNSGDMVSAAHAIMAFRA